MSDARSGHEATLLGDKRTGQRRGVQADHGAMGRGGLHVGAPVWPRRHPPGERPGAGVRRRQCRRGHWDHIRHLRALRPGERPVAGGTLPARAPDGPRRPPAAREQGCWWSWASPVTCGCSPPRCSTSGQEPGPAGPGWASGVTTTTAALAAPSCSGTDRCSWPVATTGSRHASRLGRAAARRWHGVGAGGRHERPPRGAWGGPSARRLRLVAGGDNSVTTESSADVYEPATRTWAPAAPMAEARWVHSATLLRGGRVLVAGGQNAAGNLSSAEVFTS